MPDPKVHEIITGLRAQVAERDATILRWEKSFNNMGAAFDATVVELHALCIAVLGADPDSVDEYQLATTKAASTQSELEALREEVERLKSHVRWVRSEGDSDKKRAEGLFNTNSTLRLELTACQQQLRQVDDFLASREMAAKGGTDYKTALHELVCMEVDQATTAIQQQLAEAQIEVARLRTPILERYLAMEQQLERAREALNKFGGHIWPCQWEKRREEHCLHCGKVKDRHYWNDMYSPDGACKDERGRPELTKWSPRPPLDWPPLDWPPLDWPPLDCDCGLHAAVAAISDSSPALPAGSAPQAEKKNA